MLQTIYVLLVLVNLIVFLLFERRISYLFVYYISSCVYYLDAIIGVSFVRTGDFGQMSTVSIDSKTYWIMIINMLFILIALVIGRRIKNKRGPDQNYQNAIVEKEQYYTRKNVIAEKYAIRVMILVCLIIAIFEIIPTILSSLGNSFSKADLLEDATSAVSYYKSIAMFLMVYLFTQKRIKYGKLEYVLVVALMALTLLLGHRSYFVISIIGIIVTRINQNTKEANLLALSRKNWKKILLVVICFFVFIFSKNIYSALFNGNLELVQSRLSDSSYYVNSFKENEFNVIFTNLDTVVKQNYSFPLSTYLQRTAAVFVPVASRFIDSTPFSTAYQRDLFNTNIRASTYLGEAYASGRIALSVISIIVVLFLVAFFDKRIGRVKSNMLRTFFIVSAVDFAFYIHRNSLEYSLIRIRSYLYIFLFGYILYLIFRRMARDEK